MRLKHTNASYGQAALEQLSTLVGAPVVAAARCGWGFENETVLVTLAGGRRLIVQWLASRERAGVRLGLARELPARLASVGIRAPRQLSADANADPPYAVCEYLPGEPGASCMGTSTGAVALARAMGALLPQLAQTPTHGTGLDTTWASPDRLARQATQQLARCRKLLGGPAAARLEANIAALPGAFAGRPAVFAHGDFCPVNVLADDQSISAGGSGLVLVGLVDLECARLADPLFDPAWWGWVVRYHHPERWLAAWPALLAAAGIVPDAATRARIQLLQALRCLEQLDDHAHMRAGDAAGMWAERLRATLAWDAAE